MEALMSSSLEEVCCSGARGLSLSCLWPTLTPKPTLADKASLWSNLRSIPSFQFTIPGEDTPLSREDVRIQRFDHAEKLGLKITANQHLRDCFVGLYDASSSNFSDRDRRALDRLLAARTSGITQSQLGKDLGIEGNNLYYVVKTLECRGLIVRQPVVVKKSKDAENSSTVTTNLIYLSRYAKHLGVQQRFEIEKCADGEECGDTTEDGDGLLVRDFVPAMKAICDKLEEANDKVLVISDIKQDLGYRGNGPAGHKSWRVICNRLKEAHIVEEFEAKVNEKVVRCLRLLKEFSTENFEQVTKCGRRSQQNDQLVELAIERQIYDMVDAKGTEGAIFMEVCGRLGVENKRDFRSRDMVSKYGMHLQKEIYKRTVVTRVWTSGNFNSEQLFQGKSQIVLNEKKTTNLDVGNPDVPDRPIETFLEYDNLTSNVENVAPGKQINTETASEFSCGSPKEGKPGNVPEFFHESRGLASNAGLDVVGLEMGKNAASTEIAPSTFRKQPMPLTTDGALREQRILEYLQDEKFIFRAELHRWLVSHEKDKCTILDRKTIDRILDKLQKQGHCKCVTINVPAVTNCSRSRRTMVVLHPSLESFPSELVGEMHDRLRSFEKEIRGQRSSRWKTHEPLPVLNGVMRTQLRVGSNDNAAQSEAMRANGFVLAKMVRAKLLHCFLWGYLSSFPGWDDVLSSGMHTCTYKHFELEVALKAIPIELFLQVVGSTQNFEDMLERCRKGLRLCDIPIEDYKCVMNTRATGRLSYIIDILRRLKLIRLVKDGHSEEGAKMVHATCTHALELRPYVEEPLSLCATANIRSLDLRPRVRHDFILSNREAVDEYWKILEYCYAAADPTAALHAFPGSAVPEVCLERSWASVRVMSADQRAELLKCIVKDDPHKKISYKYCEKIAKDLNLSLQQVLRVYYDKRQKRLNTFQGSIKANSEENPSSKRKRSSASNKKRKLVEPSLSELGSYDSENEQSGEKGLTMSPSTLNKFMEEKDPTSSREHADCFPAFKEDDDHLSPVEEQESDAECYSFISQCTTLRRKATGRSRFSWTDERDRLLVIQYAKHRATLGAKFHRVDWSTLPELPAPPRTCARRMASLNQNKYFRKALMKLCTVLSERYMKHLENGHFMSSNSDGCRVLVQCSLAEGLHRRISTADKCTVEANSEEEQWDDFTHKSVKKAFEDVLMCKQVAKMDTSKKVRSASGEQPHLNSNTKEYSSKESEWLSSGKVNEAQNLDSEKCKDSAKRSRWPRIHQKFMKLLNEWSSVSRQVHESLAVSNAVELLKLIFLSTSTEPNLQNLLAETLRRYSEHDLFAAFSYLREKKIMIGGNGDQPFQLSQQFLHSISRSPFPANTGQRAAKISGLLHDRQKELVERGINLTADLHCGDIFQLFALVSSGELSIYPCVPHEGVGEVEDLRSSKRKSEDELSDGHKAKKLKSLADSELISRREKGFPHIVVSMQRAIFLTTDAVEMFKDGETCAGELYLNDKANVVVGEKMSPSSYHGELMQEVPKSVSVLPTAGWSTHSPWDAMAGYAEHLLLKPSGAEQVPWFNSQVFKAAYTAIQTAGDQGLSMEEVSQVVGENIHEHVINILQAFGQVLKVNAYASVRVVDALYHSKYFLMSSAGFHHDLKLDSVKKSLQRSNDNHVIYQPQNCCVVGANSQTGVITTNNDVHKVTILNLPEEVVPLDGAKVINGHQGYWLDENPLGSTNASETLESFCQESTVPILPWINGDGTINKFIYNGLVRRVFGTVMQNPGILEDGIIRRIDALNPQSCRTLLDLMILDKHIVARDMLQSTSRGPPPLLGTLLGNSYRESKLVYRRHFFANPKSASLL